mmetsp:Transcript_4454/g.6593  ORF Transcript_4454/g.6593 Transcript_4454/m.6593 type:complete len:133 (+) Transcript_4454:135-533(+)|eukprot:CAMPEP_0170508914 /NCGR_PEP_ID=MMETSP0208-20121228/63802_1 /TAXON_ID=197538 /ORGANISM="Strombidium inclinatum, Strain S3" /LENGTH=132 /DNA_ID=CAMNT_0010792077 /DNA_START=71 /DNA_END=469 /DNA_ORIENTATION=+
MVQFHDYPVLRYPVVTKDGYILTIHRIPGPKGEKPVKSAKKAAARTPVLFLHGILSSDELFVASGSEGDSKALPYQIADTGDYDVWMMNFRGNSFSRQHMWLDPDFEEDFWSFSFEEFGDQDLPSVLDFMRT